MTTSATLYIATKVVAESNQRSRSHWPRTSRTKRVRADVALMWRSDEARPLRAMAHLRPLLVTLTRVAPGTLDSANLWSAMKAPQDEVADQLDLATDREGVDGVHWRVDQRKGLTAKPSIKQAAEYAVEVTLQHTGPAPTLDD